MLNRRFPLGTYFGIGLYVHWTFSLLLLAVAADRWTHGHSWQQVLVMVGIVLTMYLCVTLHEYGHALMARRFGVGTRDITLLPIGGVARLERMPRVPWQELLIAVAGPAVNVVIAMLLMAVVIVLSLTVDGFQESAWRSLAEFDTVGVSAIGFMVLILISNIVLVVFNMIPAFPMDGGRVLRSLLAMVLDYRKATWLASRIGLGCAVLMGVAAWTQLNWVMLLIACFVAWAGMMEARQVAVTESVRGLKVSDAMITMDEAATVPATDSLQELAWHWRSDPRTVLPVTDPAGYLVGMVHLRDLAKAIRGGQQNQLVASITRQDLPTVHPDQRVEFVLSQPPPRRVRQLPVVSYAGQFVGLLDLDSLLDRASMSPATARDLEAAAVDAEDGTLFSA